MVVFAAIFGIAFVAIIGYDIYLAATKGWNATLSWWIYYNSLQYPIIPAMFGFFIGLLFGHFFWDQLQNVTVCPAVTSQ